MRWFALLPLSILFLLLATILSPILPLFASKDGWLPHWLWWFQTPDFSLDGDEGFKTEHAPYKGESLTAWQIYYNRLRWLWRNPAYGFDWGVLAYYPESGDELKVWGRGKVNGNVVKDDPILVTGWLPYGGWYFAKRGYAWQLYLRFHWNETHCTKINLGWKLWGISPHQFVFSPTGFWKKIS